MKLWAKFGISNVFLNEFIFMCPSFLSCAQFCPRHLTLLTFALLHSLVPHKRPNGALLLGQSCWMLLHPVLKRGTYLKCRHVGLISGRMRHMFEKRGWNISVSLISHLPRPEQPTCTSHFPPPIQRLPSMMTTPLEVFSAGDDVLLEKCKEIYSWFPSTKALAEHALQLLIDARMDEIEWIIPDRFKGVTCIGVFVWVMREVMESPDPR